MRRAGVHAVQAVDDMQSFLVRFERTESAPAVLLFASEPLLVIPLRNTGLRIEALILHKEDDTLWSRVTGGRRQETVGDKWEAQCGAGRHALKRFSAVEHDRSFNEITGQWSFPVPAGIGCGPFSNTFTLQYALQRGSYQRQVSARRNLRDNSSKSRLEAEPLS